MAQVAAGAGFIQEVNGLVRQETIRDVAFRQLDDARHDGVGHTDAVVLFIVDADALDDLDGVQQRRFLDLDRLETALQRGILLNILAILANVVAPMTCICPRDRAGFMMLAAFIEPSESPAPTME